MVSSVKIREQIENRHLTTTPNFGDNWYLDHFWHNDSKAKSDLLKKIIRHTLCTYLTKNFAVKNFFSDYQQQKTSCNLFTSSPGKVHTGVVDKLFLFEGSGGYGRGGEGRWSFFLSANIIKTNISFSSILQRKRDKLVRNLVLFHMQSVRIANSYFYF